MNMNEPPVVALTLGDPAGIGPELIAKLLADPATCAQANVVLVGDPWSWEDGQTIARRRVEDDSNQDCTLHESVPSGGFNHAAQTVPCTIALPRLEPCLESCHSPVLAGDRKSTRLNSSHRTI